VNPVFLRSRRGDPRGRFRRRLAPDQGAV